MYYVFVSIDQAKTFLPLGPPAQKSFYRLEFTSTLATTDSTPSCLSGGTTRNICEKVGFTGDLVCRADTGSFDALEAHYLIT